MAYTTYYVVGPSSGWSDPTATEIKAGQLSGGGAATASGSEASLGASGTHTFATPASGLSANTLYKTAYVASDGTTNSNIVVSGDWGSKDLVIQDATHAHAADSIGLSTNWLLSLQDATHAHTADNLTLTLTGSTDLAIQDGAHGHVADNLGLSTDVLLSIAEALHGHAADNVGLDTSNATNLTIQDALHSHIADTLGLSLDTWLAIAEAIHPHLADNMALTSEEALDIADALHAHAADNVVLWFGSAATTPSYRTLQIVREIRALSIPYENRTLVN